MPTVLELYEKLKPKLGEEEARSLLEYMESTVERRAATKEDLLRTETSLREEMARVQASLRGEIARVEASLRSEIAQVQASLRGEIARVEALLREEIHKARADLLKWAFAFWVGNVAALAGIMFALLRSAAGR